MTHKIYGALSGATVFALNDQAGYDQAVADGVGDRWREVPEETVVGSSFVDEGGEETWTHPDTTPGRLRVVDSNTFFSMFTAFEEVAIRDFAEKRDPEEPEQTQTVRKAIGVMLGRLERATNVDLDLPANIAGIGLLVSCGVLTEARAAEILAGPLVG